MWASGPETEALLMDASEGVSAAGQEALAAGLGLPRAFSLFSGGLRTLQAGIMCLFCWEAGQLFLSSVVTRLLLARMGFLADFDDV